jgi:hypothetical protein
MHLRGRHICLFISQFLLRRNGENRLVGPERNGSEVEWPGDDLFVGKRTFEDQISPGESGLLKR